MRFRVTFLEALKNQMDHLEKATQYIVEHFPDAAAFAIAGTNGQAKDKKKWSASSPPPTSSSDIDIFVIYDCFKNSEYSFPLKIGEFDSSNGQNCLYDVNLYDLASLRRSVISEIRHKKAPFLLDVVANWSPVKDTIGIKEKWSSTAKKLLEKGPDLLSKKELAAHKKNTNAHLKNLESAESIEHKIFHSLELFGAASNLQLACERHWQNHVNKRHRRLFELSDVVPQKYAEALDEVFVSGNIKPLRLIAHEVLEKASATRTKDEDKLNSFNGDRFGEENRKGAHNYCRFFLGHYTAGLSSAYSRIPLASYDNYAAIWEALRLLCIDMHQNENGRSPHDTDGLLKHPSLSENLRNLAGAFREHDCVKITECLDRVLSPVGGAIFDKITVKRPDHIMAFLSDPRQTSLQI